MTGTRRNRTANEALLTAEAVKEILEYDPQIGRFTWKKSLQGRVKAGQEAGAIKQGYRRIEIKNIRYGAHRLAWLLVYGSWPEGDLDHVNGDALDNRIGNLREATISQNMANRKRASHNKSGVKGVIWDDKSQRWVASVRQGGVSKYVGYFKTKSEARDAYRRAAKELHGEFARFD